jgi:hypothetical protein
MLMQYDRAADHSFVSLDFASFGFGSATPLVGSITTAKGGNDFHLRFEGKYVHEGASD